LAAERRFTVERMVDDYEAMYRSMLGRPQLPPADSADDRDRAAPAAV
jgi:hypothetical protein